MKYLQLFALFVGSLALGQAEPILLNSTVSNVVRVTPSGMSLDVLLGAPFGLQAGASFTGSLSSASSWEYTIGAAAGSEFFVRPQPYAPAGQLSFGNSVWAAPGGGDGSLATRYLPTTVTFTDFAGTTWASNTVLASVDTTGKNFKLAGALIWSGMAEFSFTSMTVKVDTSSLAGMGFAEATYTPGLMGLFYQPSPSSPVSPLVQGMSLRPTASVPDAVPTAALMGLALGVIFWRGKMLSRIGGHFS